MTGHGGDNFLKFQDSEEINAYDIADAFEQMKENGRYNEILFIIDTCQASTMFERFRSPQIFAISSSRRGESSYSYHVEDDVGVALIDRFTFCLLNFMKDLTIHSDKTVGDFVKSWDTTFLGSHPETRQDLFSREMDEIRLLDFFGNSRQVSPDAGLFGPVNCEGCGELAEFLEKDQFLGMDLDHKTYQQFKAFDLAVKPNANKAPFILTGVLVGIVASLCFL